MRSITVRKLRSNLAEELKDLPVQITSDGEVIATIVPNLGSVHIVAKAKEVHPDSVHKLDAPLGYATKDVPMPSWMRPK